MSRRPKRADILRKGAELGNVARNERQKNVFLCEVSKIHKAGITSAIEQVSSGVETSKQIIEQSRKSRQHSSAPIKTRRKVGKRAKD